MRLLKLSIWRQSHWPYLGEVLNLTEQKRISDLHPQHQIDDLGRSVEIAEQFFEPRRLRITIQYVCFDSAKKYGVERIIFIFHNPIKALRIAIKSPRRGREKKRI